MEISNIIDDPNRVGELVSQLGRNATTVVHLLKSSDVVSAVAQIKSGDDKRMLYQAFHLGFSQATEEQRRWR